MKYKLFISAAGKGTRMAGLSAINKSLLPINYEAVKLSRGWLCVAVIRR